MHVMPHVIAHNVPCIVKVGIHTTSCCTSFCVIFATVFYSMAGRLTYAYKMQDNTQHRHAMHHNTLQHLWCA